MQLIQLRRRSEFHDESPRPLDTPRLAALLTELRCLRRRGAIETASPFRCPPGRSVTGSVLPSCSLVCRYWHAPLAACRPPQRSRPTSPGMRFAPGGRSPFRAEMHVASTPAGKPPVPALQLVLGTLLTHRLARRRLTPLAARSGRVAARCWVVRARVPLCSRLR